MKVSIIAVGDELLIGQVVNTNAAWLGETLTDAGLSVVAMHTVADDANAIRSALRQATEEADIVLVSGGLGPTHDDITRGVVAEYFDRPLRFQLEIFEKIRRRFEARNIPVAQSNRSQAMVPEGFDVLANPIGTAPGLWHRLDLDDRSVDVVLLPGVPRELKRIVREALLPRLDARLSGRRIERKTILTTGIGESNLNRELGDLSSFLDENVRLAFLPGIQGVRLRITTYSDGGTDADDRAARLEAVIRDRAEAYLFGDGQDTMEAVVGRLLREVGHTIAVAESCTGGLVMSRLTDVPGASEYTLGGIVAYADEVKVQLLGVDAGAVSRHGAVSRAVVVAMAEGIRTKMGASVGVATSGILGPGGGTPEKPVGTVWIACADAEGATAKRLRLGTDRDTNKERAAIAALDLVRRRLLKT